MSTPTDSHRDGSLDSGGNRDHGVLARNGQTGAVRAFAVFREGIHLFPMLFQAHYLLRSGFLCRCNRGIGRHLRQVGAPRLT